MPKFAILSDIHGNLPALQAVLHEVGQSGAGYLVVAGDIIGYGADPKRCVELLQRLGAQVVMGNHESYALEVLRKGPNFLVTGWHKNPVSAGVVHALEELKGPQMDWIATLPWMRRMIDDTVVAHSTLVFPEQWEYMDSDVEARPTLDLMRTKGLRLAFFGHTHLQRWFAHPDAPAQPVRVGEHRLMLPKGSICAVTVGAVGQPRSEVGDTRATWVLWDSDAQMLEFRQTSYPVELAVRAILEAGLPKQSAERLWAE